ncbi:MAG: 5-(carboxyamino)imidazole ribonucleotide synthase [Gammaproteobacteria bacterium]|nr:5-(carboxyamino)imidazole ribonucleotide synthase [Gammaproteobacteria bacterium]
MIGVLGGGQLARMLALAGYPLGLNFIVLDPAEGVCSASLAHQLKGAYDDKVLLARLAEKVDVVTYEFENVPAESVAFLADKVAIYPPRQALATAQDRLTEKTACRDLGIDTAPFVAVNSLADLQAAMDKVGWPAVLKTRSEGYDGKGQAVLHQPEDLAEGWRAIGEVPAIVEGFVSFDREISMIAVRSCSGETAFYPLTENEHQGGILRVSIARPNDAMQGLAEEYAAKVLNKLNYVGVLALELFQAGDRLLVNEFAPRVHNSGHWTQDGAVTCQFENHLRAILGLPLGATDIVGYAGMVNLIGEIPDSKAVLAINSARLHLYDKKPRAGRKVGHINLMNQEQTAFETDFQTVLDLVADRHGKGSEAD